MVFTGNPLRHRHGLLGFAVAIAGLLTTLWLAQQQARSVATISEARFLQEARAFSDALAQRMATHTEIVNGLRSLFMVNPVLSRAEFERAARELDVRQPQCCKKPRNGNGKTEQPMPVAERVTSEYHQNLKRCSVTAR